MVAIVGTVGSGKSALLGCILGELEKVGGQVRTCRLPLHIAYWFAILILFVALICQWIIVLCCINKL